MHALDWVLFVGFLGYVVYDGVRRSAKNHDATDHFLAGRSARWWVVGLSIMATQASAITMVGTTGSGWQDGMRFVQFYYALPIAMVILAFTIVPLYHRHQVSTAYEYLGLRFDRKTRILTAAVFLIQRCLAAGIVVYTAAVVLSALLGWAENTTILVIGTLAMVYTTIGGMRAVLSTDVKQMAVMAIGLGAALAYAVKALPEGVGLTDAWSIAGALERTTLLDTRWDPSEKYTIWSSLLGGLFVFLAYFGADQSQAQRLLSSRSLGHSRGALMLNAVAKIPFQMTVLLLGTVLFVGYMFSPPPASFMTTEQTAIEADRAEEEALVELSELQDSVNESARRFAAGDEEVATLRAAIDRAESHRQGIRTRVAARAGTEPGGERNYVFPYFILSALPIGLVGLLIAAIFAAALSSIDSELNSMATVWVVDVERFAFGKQIDADAEIRNSRRSTFGIGCCVIVAAYWFSASADVGNSVIEAVNQIGSYFYGSILGVFVLAVAVRFANGTGAFWGLLAGISAVFVVDRWQTIHEFLWQEPTEAIGFLYLNTVGVVVCVVVGVVISILANGGSRRA